MRRPFFMVAPARLSDIVMAFFSPASARAATLRVEADRPPMLPPRSVLRPAALCVSRNAAGECTELTLI